ncbi:hypothetical protein CA13_44650 [Planctomycetes bacterium CA13]|uniref:Tetratricopeptide repeat protein n=2 Tax=Novipirellula herctigrandis TaxID=2527986 RepID=A0A5C5Z6R5_9BACT|nr:hypothetical protein CA13_44650 [Planctomycetes bacterium CA13]
MLVYLRSHSQQIGSVLLRAVVCSIFVLSSTLVVNEARADGEPVQDFLKRLRAGGYFDTSITYLDRINEYPGVDPSFLEAIDLEKAQTYIDAAVDARSATERDEYFAKAASSLSEFLKNEDHPRVSEARLQLGKLQMVRAGQLLMVKPDDQKKALARESYLAASKTFDTIVENLRSKLKEMQGQKIDASADPELAARRTQYRGEFLDAKLNKGESRRLAAMTFAKPAEDGKKLLEEAVAEFQDLSDNYDGFVTGATSLLNLGQSFHTLGEIDKATDSYIRLLELPDLDPLRDARFQATTGLIQIALSKSPPDYQTAIDRGQAIVKDVRPNEKQLASVLSLKVDLAKSYLLKSKDKENLKNAETKKAESEGRQLLVEIEKLPGDHLEETAELLGGLGIQIAEVELPKAEDPESLDDAMDSARQLLEVSESSTQAIALLEKQGSDDPEIATQIEEMSKQVKEARLIAIQILQRGITMIGPSTDLELLGQARQILAYLLYQEKRYRDATVVGSFLAQTSPGTETGLKGGLLALNSFQMLLSEIPEDQNGDLVGQIEKLGDFLTSAWPNDPQAAAAQGVMIRLAMQKDRWDQANELIAKMPAGAERSTFERLLGRLLWNGSIMARRDENLELAAKQLADAEQVLRKGLEGMDADSVENEAMQAALVLAKVYLRSGDSRQALAVLDDPTYGPVKLVDKLADEDKLAGDEDAFRGDLAATELNIIVARMTSDDGDADAMLQRATSVMEKLQATYQDEEGQKRLIPIYVGMARDLKEELDSAPENKKAKLIEAFRVFLNRIAQTSNDPATLQWILQTLVQLGEAAMQPAEVKATGQAAELLDTAVSTYGRLQESSDDVSLSIQYQYGRAQRLLGKYKGSLDTFQNILAEKPMMLDAQVEAATAYEKWATELPAKFASKSYAAALNGARPGADKKNIIWGWGKISQLTSRDKKFEAIFFDARYHVALSRFLWGRSAKDTKIMKKAESDITKVVALYPDLGGAKQRKKFDSLLREIQKAVGNPVTGLPPNS